jgi:peptidoglycan/LPS O-acetylase OafA/YrhL
VRDFSKRIPELDGIRGVAILTILLYHGLALEGFYVLPGKVRALLSFGWSGVDLFFVLSGFLIGGILLDVREADNYYSVFYIRRAYRILPLYGALCIFSVLVFRAHIGTHNWLFDGNVPWYAYLTFGQNFWMAKLNDISPRQIDTTWSLAIEEQFYLTLPFIIRILSRKALPYAIGAGLVLAPLIRIGLWFALEPSHRKIAMYVLAPCRMDPLLWGVLAACAVRSAVCWDWLVVNERILTLFTGMLGLGVVGMAYKRLTLGSFSMIAFGYSWLALFFVCILLLAVTQAPYISGTLKLMPLTELGILAYCLYLFNYPVLGLVYGVTGRTSPQLDGFATVSLTLLSGVLVFMLARASWDYLERPLVMKSHLYKFRLPSDASGGNDGPGSTIVNSDAQVCGISVERHLAVP